MTRAEFIFLCNKYCVAPALALAGRDDAKVEELLKTKFWKDKP